MSHEAAALVGVDLGGTWVRAVLAGADGVPGLRDQARTVQDGPEAVMDQIALLVTELATRSGGRDPANLRLAIGVPGPVNGRSGVVHEAPNLEGWHEVALAEGLRRRLGCDCAIEHDAALAALGEHRRGAGRGTSDFVYITVSTGIGAGMLLEGRLRAGPHGTAGEFGHMVVVPDGPLCACGNRGCLEAVASGTALASLAGAKSAQEVAERARSGEELASRLFQEAGLFLGRAVGGLINLLDPEVVALGGGVMSSADQVWPALRLGLEQGSFARVRRNCRIEPAQLGEDQGLIGALELAKDRLATD